MRVLSVVGTRPNFAKLAAVHRALRRRGARHEIVHTGQHYDAGLSGTFFRDLEIPEPHLNLGVGSGSHAAQAAGVLVGLERRLLVPPRPDWVLVYGDVNSTAAAALCAVKVGLRVGHVEAGLRSGDRTMPEEHNRVVADHLSDLLFATTPSAARNLRREGIPARRIRVVGNTMIDTLRWALPRARRRDPRALLGVDPARRLLLLTLHRPSNVDDRRVLAGIWGAMERVAREATVVFPVHPRTRARLRRWGLARRGSPGLRIVDPMRYLDFLALFTRAAVVVTDSGSIQDEAAYLGVPCLTVRSNTERPDTLADGRNRLVGNDPAAILRGLRSLGRARRPPPLRTRLDDGRAGERIAGALLEAGGG